MREEEYQRAKALAASLGVPRVWAKDGVGPQAPDAVCLAFGLLHVEVEEAAGMFGYYVRMRGVDSRHVPEVVRATRDVGYFATLELAMEHAVQALIAADALVRLSPK